MKTFPSVTRKTLWASLLCLFIPTAFGNDWPLSPVKPVVPASAYSGRASAAPVHDCQPDPFDPKVQSYQQTSPASAVLATYHVDGDDADTTLTINSRIKADDIKTTLPNPYTLTRYVFSCSGASSEVLEFDKDGKRNALFTHVGQAQFTPDMSKLVLYNYAKPHHGPWQHMRRIYDVRARRFTPLPMIKETMFLADVGANQIVTYGLPLGSNKPGTIAVWGLNGKLIRAYSAPLSAENGGRADGAIGLLPGDQSAFYHLSRTGENESTLRLQDIHHPNGQRALKLAVPGAANQAVVVGTHVQLDLGELTLKGGTLKYRVSSDGKTWGDWQTAQ